MKKISYLIFALLLITFPILRWVVLPWIEKYDQNFSYQANIFSFDNFYNESEQRFSGEILSVTDFGYKAEKSNDKGLLVNNYFDVKRPSGEKIFSIERKYGINPIDGSHVQGIGDRNRSGYLFAPRGIKKGESYTYWHVNYNVPAEMKFQHEELILGLIVYKYVCNYEADQTDNLGFLPGVPKERGVKLDILLETWIDPITGWMIKYQDHTTAWYYDIHTKKKLNPWNRFHNEYQQSSIKNQVEIAKNKQFVRKLLILYIPVGLACIALILVLTIFSPTLKIHYRHFTFLGVSFFGVALSFWLYSVLNNIQKEKQFILFENETQKILSEINREIKNMRFDILGLFDEYMGEEIHQKIPERSWFKKKTERILKKSNSLIAVGYTPVVNRKERKILEERANVQFTEMGRDNKLVPASEREVYYPVYLIEPYETNKLALGFDLGSNPERIATLKKGAQTGDFVFTPPIKLIQYNSSLGVIAYYPLYEINQEKKREISGFLSGVYILDKIINTSINSQDINKKIKVVITDKDEKGEKSIFSNYNNELKNPLSINKMMPLFNRNWQYYFYLESEPVSFVNHAILILGISLTLLCAFFIFQFLDSIDKSKQIMLQLVQIKKMETALKESNITLEERVKERTSDLKKTQVTLQLSEEKYRKIVTETGDAVYSSDYKGYFTYVNPVCKKLTGYTANELVGKLFSEIIAPDWKEKVAKFYKEQFDKKVQETSFSFPIITKSGEKKWIEQTVTQIKEGDLITGHNAIVRDITERKKAEEKLKEFMYFFNGTTDLACIANIQGYFEILNPNWEKILGYSEKELLASQFLNFVHPDDIASTLREVEKLKTGALTIHFINRYRKKDGSYLWFDWNTAPDTATGKLYAIARDITDRKKAEEEIKQKSEELARSNQELEQFAYVASHDLQEPLRTIANFVGLLDKKHSGKTDEDTIPYFKFILAATSKMQNLIKDLLEFSRIGKSMSFVAVDCNKILKDVIADLDLSIKESKAKITSVILPVLLGNETELKRLFQNLISNAIKFVKKDIVPEITITVEEKNTEYLFTIKDNGIGIEEQYFKKLFIIFQRLNAVTEYPGTGIGLATCKKIIDLHNGKIWIESKFGEGSTFYFTLPKGNNLKHNGT